MKEKVKHDKFSPLTVIMLVVLCLYVLVLFALLLWGFMQVFKDWYHFADNRIWFPEAKYFNLSNLQAILAYTDQISWANGKTCSLVMTIVNSIVYAFGCAFVNTLVTSVTAYLAAKYSYKFSKIIYMIVIVVMVIPVIGSQSSELEILMKLQLYNTRWGLIVLKSSFVGVYFLVIYENFKALPDTYSEAAMIDGANDWYIMTRIAFPLCKNCFLTVLLINFIAYWNDFQTPFLYAPDYPTLSYLMYKIQNEPKTVDIGNGSKINTAIATVKVTAAFVLALPPLVLFSIFNERLMGNLSIGGIKG